MHHTQTHRMHALRTTVCLLTIAMCAAGWAGCGGQAAEENDWVARFRAKVDALGAEGQPVTLEEVLARRQRPTDGENSALLFLKAFEQLETEDFGFLDSLCSVPDVGRGPSEQLREAMQKSLNAFSRTLDLLRQAARLPPGAYPDELSLDGLPMHMQAARQATKLLGIQAVFLAASGQPTRSAESIIAARRVAASSGDSPFLMESLVRMSIDIILLERFERSLALCEMPVEMLRRLRTEFDEEARGVSMTPALLGERAYMLRAYTVHPESGWRQRMSETGADWNPQLESALRELLAEEGLLAVEIYDRLLEVAALPDRAKLSAMTRFQQDITAKVGEQQWPPEGALVTMAGLLEKHGYNIRRALAEYDKTGLPRYPLASAHLTGLGMAFESQVQAAVSARVAGVALAAEEWRIAHGDWPESLEELVPDLLDAVPEDPFADEGVLRYLQTPTGVRIYSFGRNRRDDAGTAWEEAEYEEEAEGVGYPQSDIVFRLVDPKLRGAEAVPLREEIADSLVDLAELEELGLTREKLLKAGLTAEDIELLERAHYLPDNPEDVAELLELLRRIE